MRRAEVWWADLPRPVGSRPVLILTRDAVLPTIGGVVVALVTRTIRDLPTEVILGRQQGLPVRCVANFDNMLTVPRDRFKRLMEHATLRQLNRSIVQSRLRLASNSPQSQFSRREDRSPIGLIRST